MDNIIEISAYTVYCISERVGVTLGTGSYQYLKITQILYSSETV